MKNVISPLLHNIEMMKGAFIVYGGGLLFFFLLSALHRTFAEKGQKESSSVWSYAFPASLFKTCTSWVDFWHFLLTFIIWGPLITLVTGLISGQMLAQTINGILGPMPQSIRAPWLIISTQVFVILMARHFGVFLTHFLSHKVPFLWSFHRPHHSAESLTFLTSARAHPLDSIFFLGGSLLFAAVGTALVLYVTGTSLQPTTVSILAGWAFLLQVMNIFEHSHIPFSFGKLSYVIGSPVMHHIHHSAELRHRDKNFGGIVAIWDWLFGTIYVPKGHEDYRQGLTEGELGKNNPHVRLLDYYIEPFKYFWNCIVPRSHARSDRTLAR